MFGLNDRNINLRIKSKCLIFVFFCILILVFIPITSSGIRLSILGDTVYFKDIELQESLRVISSAFCFGGKRECDLLLTKIYFRGILATGNSAS